MKNTKKTAFCGMFAALITVVCIAAYFPYFTYAMPAVAGAFLIVPLFEIGKKYAFATYLASVLPVMLFAENEAKLMYVCFFGIYPILKSVYESLKYRFSEYICKFATFNISVATVYVLFAKLFGIEDASFSEFGKYGVFGLLLLGNVAFFLYDICLTRLGAFYTFKLKKYFLRFFK